MKRVISIALALCLCLVCFVGCGNKYKGWEDQTLEDISYKSSPTWDDDTNYMETHAYYLTQTNVDADYRYKEDNRICIGILEDSSVFEVLSAMKDNTYRELEPRKIDDEEAVHFSLVDYDLDRTEYIYLFSLPNNRCARIEVYILTDLKDQYNEKDIELFLDSIKINK